MCDAEKPLTPSSSNVVAVARNHIEDRALKTKLELIQLEEKNALRKLRSEIRLIKIRQHQRLGNLAQRKSETEGTLINQGAFSSEVCLIPLLISQNLLEAVIGIQLILVQKPVSNRYSINFLYKM